MKRLRRFNSLAEMQAAIQADKVSFIGMYKQEGQSPIMNIHVHTSILPSNLVISCENNIVTITAEPVGEVTIEYRFNYEGEYITYTQPFAITETVIVSARAMTKDGSINRNQQCEYVELPTNLVISCSNNTVTITATNATTIEYNTNGSSTYTTYTQPFAITETVTVYARATNSGGSITGSQECVYEEVIDYTIPFYIEDISGSSNTLQIKKTGSSAPTLTIEKSTDGSTWTTMGTTSTTAITATVPANSKLYLRCNTNAWSTLSYYNYINTTGDCNVGGNIMSLLYGSNFTGNETTFPSGSKYNFNGLFYNNAHLVNASDLLLPATTLTTYCYANMFYGCTVLTTAPALPATTLDTYCYRSMFYGCTGLTTAPATLPATTLANNCYQAMFQLCTSLTTAPVLSATTLTIYCYSNMFNGCTHLNYIKCLATNIGATYCTSSWVSGVAASGTFVKDPNMSSWTTGTSGIPTNWIVRNTSGISLSQDLNVVTIEVTNLDSGTGYYTINGGSQVSLSEGTTNVPITQAMNGQTLLAHGEFDGVVEEKTLTLSWIDYSPSVTITETDNYVTISASTADSITYRLGSSGEYTTYTTPVYIDADTTIYVIATKTVSGVVYTTNTSQEVEHVLIPPSNLVISCSNNFVTITATGAATLEYNLDGSSTYTTYTEPFLINQTTTVYAKATNSDGSITASQQCTYVDYRPAVTITETDNYVTISAPNANSITYRLGSSGEYTNYTTPVYIASDTTIYVIATRTVSGVAYTTETSQAVTHTLIPPTNLVISCSHGIVTITATNATTIEYNMDGSSTYTTYTEPFKITETVTVYAKASNVDGSITASQECVYDNYIDTLISMGCHFWAPLDENDITEKLSETSPTHRAGQLTWDSAKDAYKFKTSSSNQQVLVYNITNVNNLSSTLAYTIIADIWCVSNNGTMDFYTCGQTATSDGSVSCSTCQTHRFTGFTNGSWHRMMQTVNGSTLKMYIDGTVVRTSTTTSEYRGLRPSNWTAASIRNYTTIGNQWSSYSFEGYIKNVYLFDHELTSSEINSLQFR